MNILRVSLPSPTVFHSLKFLLVTLFMAAVVVSPAEAKKLTPNDVVREANTLIEEIKLVQQADGVALKQGGKAHVVPARKPRHVLQKGREVFQKIQLLRRINGLAEQQLKPFPVRAVTPGDVMQLVTQCLTAFRDMRSVYHVTTEVQSQPMPTGMKPTDAYKVLEVASKMLDQTDIPAIVPNDVYEIALTLNTELEVLAGALGNEGTVRVSSSAWGKSPTDVYNHGQKLHATLKEISETNDRLKVPGGITLLAPKKGKASPADVINLLNNILGDINAMKLAVGTKKPTIFAPAQTGKTPSNVYASLAAAQDFISKF